MLTLMAEDRQLARADSFEIIVEVARDLGSTFDLGGLLERLTNAAVRALHCDRASVFLYDAQRDELFSRAATGVTELRFSAKAGIAGQALQTRRAIVVPDAYADSRFNRSIDEQTGYRTRNLLTFPLLGHEGVVGVLQVLNKLDGPFTRADELMADALSKLAGVAVERQILLDQYHAKLRLERDLDLAREIQQRLLPSVNPSIPGFDVAGWNKPADQTGGDCFDFLPMRGGKLAFLVADATGHGIGPALIIAQCRAMLRSIATLSDDLGVIARHVNRLLGEDIPDDRFVTAAIGVLDPAAGSVCYVSAGHGPMLHYHAATGHADELAPTGMPMGIVDDTEFEVAGPLRMESGDILAFLTDGFSEWSRPDGEQFGTERIVQAFRDHPTMSSQGLIAAIYARVRAFGPTTTQRDDLTAVLVKRA